MVVRLLFLALLVGCSGGNAGTIVAMTLTDQVGPAPEGSHYELFAELHGGVVSIRKIFIQPPSGAGGANVIKEVYDYFDREQKLGVVDGYETTIGPIGGIRFDSSLDLTDATSLFMTHEDDEDTDPVPSQDVLLGCNLEARSRGTLGCLLQTVDDKGIVLGTAALVLPDDGINSF